MGNSLTDSPEEKDRRQKEENPKERRKLKEKYNGVEKLAACCVCGWLHSTEAGELRN